METREGGIGIMRRNVKDGSDFFFLRFTRAGMQPLSLRLMTSKLVSLVAQVTYTQLPSGPYLICHC